MKDLVIETNNLTKHFSNKVALDQVNIHVRQGDIYGLIGRNGAGKTTAMKIILGMIRPTEGSVKLFDSTKLDKQRRRIGSLIEAPAIYKNASAYENMKRFSIIYGGTDEEIKEILKFVGLGNVGKKVAGAFSLGMKQRLGIALALLGNPELLVLDEPINGLDPAGIKEIRDLIIKLNKEKGVTFVISSHLLDELGKIATRYGIINEGKLIEEIDSEELEARCKNKLTVTVNNVKKAKEVLKKAKLLNEFDENGKSLTLYSDIEQSSKINELLVKNDVEVHELTFNRNGFEDYFIERLGK